MGEFCMPSLGADMETGKLVEWLVAPGMPVKRGDIVAVVETQKGAIDIEIFEDGMLEQLLGEPGASGEGCAVVMASSLSFPSLTKPVIELEVVVSVTLTSPDTRAVDAGAWPL